ncbi:MAG: dTDP-glucose 4,6-dehydratase [Gammaproteobacteria bacterium]|nr:dTDP-glucose 4,6-dehydratase [Gammaproteobacteria bacterium]
MRKLLVTGGAGFIGANFVRHLLHSDPQISVVTLDRLTYAGTQTSLHGLPPQRHHFVHGDICDAELVSKLLHDHALDTIVHFAAESHVDRSIAAPGEFVRTNVVGTYTLLEAARTAWLAPARRGESARFHHVSTDEVYGSLAPDAPPFSEATAYDPRSPYSASKAASDHLASAYHHTYGLPLTISNCSNNYGPYQFPEKLIPLLIVNALHGRELPIYGDGGQIRDWLYVEDHCRGIERVLRDGRPGQTYNIGGGNQWRNLDLCRRLCRMIDETFAADARLRERFPAAAAAQGGRTCDTIRFVADRPGHDRRYAIDAAKIRRELDFGPAADFDSGIRKTLEWYLDNDWGWRPLLSADYRRWLAQNYTARVK